MNKLNTKCNYNAKEGCNKRTNSLNNLRVVVSGEPTTYTRIELESIIRDAGASIKSAVSGLTNILVLGAKLEDGRDVTQGSKYKKAQEIIANGKSKQGLQIMYEEEFLEYFGLSKLKQQQSEQDTIDNIAIGNSFNSISDANSSSILEKNIKKHILWSEKYRPTQQSDFLANTNSFATAKAWLSQFNSDTKNKAILLVGPPGTGKTSTAIALANCLGYKLLEFNASDVRNQTKIKELRSVILGGTILVNGNVNKKVIILMDEVDGLSTGDRGGNVELIDLILSTTIPIILTANDQNSPKMRTLTKYVKVILYTKCESVNAYNRIKMICNLENIEYNNKVVESCYNNSQGDMRYFLNMCQMQLSVKNSDGISKKDLTIYDSNFVLVRKMFNAWSKLTLREKYDYSFMDYDQIPLFIAQNAYQIILAYKNNEKIKNKLAKICKAYSSITYSEYINNAIRFDSRWDLLPEYCFFSTIIPLNCCSGYTAFRIDFPRILGKLSSRNKNRRLLSELVYHCPNLSSSRLINSGYHELFGDVLFSNINQTSFNDNQIQEFVDFCLKYNIRKKEIIYSNIIDLRFKQARNLLDLITTKMKLKITKTFAELKIQAKKNNNRKLTSYSQKSSSYSDNEDIESYAEIDM